MGSVGVNCLGLRWCGFRGVPFGLACSGFHWCGLFWVPWVWVVWILLVWPLWGSVGVGFGCRRGLFDGLFGFNRRGLLGVAWVWSVWGGPREWVVGEFRRCELFEVQLMWAALGS